MRVVRFWIALLVITGLNPEGFARGERWLQGQVLENHGGTKRPAPGAQVWIVNVGNPYTTPPDGGYRVFVPDAIRDGQKIVLYVKRKGWAIDTPSGGELNLPTNLLANIVLSADSSPEFLSPGQIDKSLDLLPEKLKSQITLDGKSGPADPAQVVKEYAAEHGFASQEVLARVEERVKEFEQSGDRRRQCLAAVYRKNLDQAAMLCREGATAKTELLNKKRQEIEALSRSLQRSEGPLERRSLHRLVGRIRSATHEQFLASYEVIPERWSATVSTWGPVVADAPSPKSGPAQLKKARRQLVQLTEEVVRDLQTSGDAHYANYHFDKALAAYEESLTYLPKEELPALWATVRRNIGRANLAIGIRTTGTAIHHHLAEGAMAYHEVLIVFTKQEFPAAWAMTQTDLGKVLQAQGIRTTGEAGTHLLAESVTAYRAALTVQTKDQFPKDWAMTQNNLGVMLWDQGTRTSGEAGTRLLAEAVTAYRAALTVYTQDQLPQDWAQTQNNLGNGLQAQGLRKGGEAGKKLIRQAINAFELALEVRTREALPVQWEQTMGNLALARKALEDMK